MLTVSLKRCVDLVGATILLLVFLPLMLAVAVVVWAVMGRPILFRDERAGRDGTPMDVIKFRSMRLPQQTASSSVTDDERLTTLGRVLRRTSLDELPQLFSVLRGDMSLVGPRPLPLRYVSRYTPRQATRLCVRPGLTGWAQIHGRNAISWPERLEYDAQYVEMSRQWWAPVLDAWILLATTAQVVWQAITGRGVSSPGFATMQEFAP